MEPKKCSINESKVWCPEIHPLHLIVDKIKWMTFAGKCDTSSIIALTYNAIIFHPPKESMFCVVEMKNSPSQENTSSDKLGFWCSGEFKERYPVFFQEDSDLSFTCVSAFPLDHVVFAALTEETYQWTNQEKFETGLLVSGACNHSLLVRQNETFLSSPHHMFGSDPLEVLARFRELVAIDCGPLRQGTISTKTAISIVCLPESQNSLFAIEDEDKLHLRLCDSVVDEPSTVSGENKIVCSSIFCSESLCKSLNFENGDEVELSLMTSHRKSHHSSSRICVLQTVPDVEWRTHYDSTNRRHFNDSENIPCLKYHKTIAITSALWFNMMQPGCKFEDCDVFVKVKPTIDQLQYANEVHLSLVLSPTYSASSQFDKTLIKYLSEFSIVKVGDVIPISVVGDMDFYNEADEKSTSCQVVYYKVMQFGENEDVEKCYKIDGSHTSLYQDGTTNSFIPYLSDTTPLRHLTTGLERYSDQVKDVLKPYLAKSSDLGYTCTVLVSGQPGCGKSSVISDACRSMNLHLFQCDCLSLVGDTSGATEAKIKDMFRKASIYAPCLLLLRGVQHLGRNRESGQAENRVCRALADAALELSADSLAPGDRRYSVLVAATAPDQADVVAEIRTQFLHQIDLEAPIEEERHLMAKYTSQSLSLSRDVDFRWIAKHTAGFIYGDFWELVRKATHVCHNDIIDKCAVGSKLSWREEQCVCMAGMNVSHQHFVQALRQLQAERADSIGVPEIPDVKWDDIGGLEEVKNHILDTIQLPLDHPQLVAAGLRRSGVLLYGPPGTGKTLLAKAVASQCALSFLSVKGPELINMYVGQSEENVRKVFQRARDAAPCVIFFDELDALAPNRGRSGDSGGVMDRVVSQLLAELDGVNGAEDQDKQVFVIAASNRPDLIDSALLRPGRLDKLLYVGISENRSDQLKVLQAQTKRLNLSPSVCLEQVVERCPPNITGADFYALTCDAAMNAVRRHIRSLEEEDSSSTSSKEEERSLSCQVEQRDLIAAAESIVPSVDARQLDNYKMVKAEMAR